jgi:hypothetical protein
MQMNRILFLLVICSFFSCDVINGDEEVPSFVELERFSLAATPDVGSVNQNITEGWVYVNNNLIGAFAEGSPFPVLEGGQVEIIVDPGIHENGIGFTPSLYPYYTRYRTTANLVRGEVNKVNPVFEYRENTDFLLIQEFENNTIFTVDRDGDEETRINYTTDGALEGLSGIITLDQDNPTVNVATSTFFNLPTFGVNDPWLEINFKTDVPLALGLLSFDDGGNVSQLYGHGLNTTSIWKKVYINLKEIIINNPTPPYQLGFGAELPSGQTTGTIMIDNIKLLQFKE